MPRDPSGEEPTSTPNPEGTPHISYPGADYSYTVDLVGSINREIGRISEAIDSLKLESREQSRELSEVAKQVYAAKVVVSVLGTLLVLIAGFIGWTVTTYISTHPPAK
jgi:hypothetical protein